MRSVGASTRPRTETSCLRGGRSGSPGRRGRSEDQPPRSLSGIFTLRGSEDMTSIKRRPGSGLCLTVLQDRFAPMEERIWREAIEAVVYELARHNGESPLDRGVALRRRLEALGASAGLATAFDQLAYERGWHMDENGFESES